MFQTHYYTLQYPKTKEKKIWTKDKIESQNLLKQWDNIAKKDHLIHLLLQRLYFRAQIPRELFGSEYQVILGVFVTNQSRPSTLSTVFTFSKTTARGVHLHNLCSLKWIDNDRPSQPNGASNSSNTGLEIVHLNIGSLKNRAHLSELWLLASERKTDIITIFETWLNTTVTALELQIDGYKLYRLDRLHKRGVRVCTYIWKELKATILKELSYIPERNFYQLWLSI